MPKRMKGILGGIITPNPPAVPMIAPQKTRSYPIFSKTGIPMVPTAAQVAGPEPEIAP